MLGNRAAGSVDSPRSRAARIRAGTRGVGGGGRRSPRPIAADSWAYDAPANGRSFHSASHAVTQNAN